MKQVLAIVSLVTLVCAVAPTWAATHYVRPSNPGAASPYTSWATASTNIQLAVDSAVNGEVILLTNGTYDVRAEIGIAKDITVTSVNGAAVTIIDGGYPSRTNRCFNISSAGAVLDGLTIRRGGTTGFGGGVNMQGGRMQNCIITENSAENCGGGISCSGSGSLVLNCLIAFNVATNGSNNKAGGGMSLASGATARGCLIVSNSAQFGGGVHIDSGSGGLVDNCTISGNDASGNGGGASVGSGLLRNTIIYFNTTPNPEKDIADDQGVPVGIFTNCCSPGIVNGVAGNITGNPLFAANFRLGAGSPCIDSGTNQLWMAGAFDLAGNDRIINTSVDIGAFEYDNGVRIIGVSGNLAFGNVVTGQTATAVMTITNSGSSTLRVTGVGYPPGFSGVCSGSIAAGKATNVTVTFAPVAVIPYTGTVTVYSDKTSGGNTISASGTGTAVAMFPIAASGASMSFAFDGSNYLVGVQNYLTPSCTPSAQMISSNGTKVGSLIPMGRAGICAIVAFDGTNSLLIWEDDGLGTFTENFQIYGQFISKAGATVGSPFPISDINANFDGIKTMVFGGGKYLVTYTVVTPSTYIAGRMVNPNGTMGSEFRISTGSGKASDVAFDGANFFVVWQEYSDKEIRGRFVSLSGVCGTEISVNASDAYSDNPKSVAFDGTNYMVVWNDEVGGFGSGEWDVFGQVVSTSGSLVGDVITISSESGQQFVTSVAFDGANYMAVWSDMQNDTNWDLYGQYIGRNGSLVGSKMPICTAPGNQMGGVGFANGKYLVLVNSGVIFGQAGMSVDASYGVFITPLVAPTRIIGVSGDLAFGNVVTGQTSTTVMTITNSGNATLTVTGIGYPPEFSGAWSGSILAGKSTNVTVTFAPTLVQAYGGTVTVTNDSTSGIGTISASGSGITAVLSIGVSGNLAFGNVTTGQTATAVMTITNSGNVSLTVTGIGYPAGFSGAWSGSIPAGKTTNVTVTFAPALVQAYGGTITVTSDATSGTDTIACSGTGAVTTTRIIGVSGNLAFGNVVTWTTATAVMTITNSGDATLTVTGIGYPVGFSGAWSGGIPAGKSTNVTVTFAPTLMQTYSGTITVSNNATSGSGAIGTSGAGIARIIGVSGNLTFGNVVTGRTATAVMTIINSGNLTLTVTSITYPAGFTGAWSGTIAAGGSHDVTVTFAPMTLMPYSGIVTVNSDKTSGGNTISASGTGFSRRAGLPWLILLLGQ